MNWNISSNSQWKLACTKKQAVCILTLGLTLKCDINFLSRVCSRNTKLTRCNDPRRPIASARTFMEPSFTILQILMKPSSTSLISSSDAFSTILYGKIVKHVLQAYFKYLMCMKAFIVKSKVFHHI